VFYACPCFHEVNNLNIHYGAGNVLARSAIFRPKSLGKLPLGPHHLSFTSSSLNKGYGYCYSEEGEEVPAERPHQVVEWIAETAGRPEIPREQLIALVTDIRDRTDPRRQPPGTSVNSDSTKHDALVALARISQVTLDLQPLVIGRASKKSD
jgi:hypothetical protein